MKKMLTLAACLLLAAMAQAASVGWTIAGANAFANGNYDVFVVGMNGVTSVDQITALVTAGTDVGAYAFADGTVNASGAASKSVSASGKSITYKEGGSAADNTYSAFAVLWTADGAEASWTALPSVTLANNSTGKTFLFGNQANNLAANKVTVGGGGVPEPTSGLLLLVGGAMLALRRKQK